MKALLVIDVQKEYMKKYGDGLIVQINRKIREKSNNNDLIIYIKNTRKLHGEVTSYEFMDELDVCSSNIFYKGKASAFSNQQLLDLLQQNCISEIEIIGIDGNCCVASTASEACKLGYKALLICNCIGVQNIERFEKKKEVLIKQGILFR